MNKPKICFIAQFPPPIHGLSKAVETLYNSRMNDKYELSKIDLTNNNRIIINVIKLIFSKPQLYYFTISQSRFGNLRDLLILSLIQLKKTPCVIHLHGGFYRHLIENDVSGLQTKLNYYVMRRVDAAIVLGRSLRGNFEGIIPDTKIYQVANCVDDEFMMNATEFQNKVERVESAQIQHVVYLSNMIVSKGFMEVLNFAKLCKDSGVFHFDFAGKFFSQHERHNFFEFVQQNRLEEIVTYHGIVTGKRKRELLGIGKYFMLPTRYPKEGQPISIIEAMANGMVVITTDHAGIPDLVRDGINGIVLSKHWDSEGLINKISKIEYIQIAKNNYKEVTEKYTQDRYVSGVMQVFKQSI